MAQQDKKKDNSLKGCPLGCLAIIACFILISGVSYLGSVYGSTELTNWCVLFVLPLAAMSILTYMTYNDKTPDEVVKKAQRALEKVRAPYKKQREKLVVEYDIQSAPIKKAYEAKVKKLLSPEVPAATTIENEQQALLDALKRDFIAKESQLVADCVKDEREECDKQRKAYTIKRRMPEGLWKVVVLMPLVFAVLWTAFGLGTIAGKSDSQPASVWNADNIPMPHMADGYQYVSNPDSILTQATLDTVNLILQRLDDELDIESAFIVVNRVEGGEAFRLAQDVGNKYGVGKNDRGLMFVLAYEDHDLNLSTGSNLEADLTDLECGQLLDIYLMPYMRVDRLNEGVVSLTKAIYAYMANKPMPFMDEPEEAEEETTAEDAFYGILGVMVVFALGWLVALMSIWNLYDDKLKNLKPLGLLAGPWNDDRVKPQPAYSPPIANGYLSSTSRSSSWGRSGSSSSSGSSRPSRSTGYGGGSFSGGGASRKW